MFDGTGWNCSCLLRVISEPIDVSQCSGTTESSTTASSPRLFLPIIKASIFPSTVLCSDDETTASITWTSPILGLDSNQPWSLCSPCHSLQTHLLTTCDSVASGALFASEKWIPSCEIFPFVLPLTSIHHDIWRFLLAFHHSSSTMSDGPVLIYAHSRCHLS